MGIPSRPTEAGLYGGDIFILQYLNNVSRVVLLSLEFWPKKIPDPNTTVIRKNYSIFFFMFLFAEIVIVLE